MNIIKSKNKSVYIQKDFTSTAQELKENIAQNKKNVESVDENAIKNEQNEDRVNTEEK